MDLMNGTRLEEGNDTVANRKDDDRFCVLNHDHDAIRMAYFLFSACTCYASLS